MGRTTARWLFVVSLCFSAAAPLPARTISVPDEEPSIQKAIDSAQTGDTVLVRAGEYLIQDSLTFRGKAITVRSEAGAASTTIRMARPLDGVIRSVVVFDRNETKAALLQGFTLTAEAPVQCCGCGGIVCSDSAPSLIDCTIASVPGTGLCSGASSTNRPGPTVTSCTITGCFVGINYTGSSATFTDCTVTGNRDAGIQCETGPATFLRCLITSNGRYGISSSGTQGPTFQDCTIEENNEAGLFCYAATLSLRGCTIQRNQGRGVFCANGAAPLLTSCTVQENRGTGVFSQDSGPILTACTISANLGEGVEWGPNSGQTPTRMTLKDCTISGNRQRGAFGWGPSRQSISASFTGCTITGNAAEGIACGFTSVSMSGCTVTRNQAGLSLRDSSFTVISGCSFLENRAIAIGTSQSTLTLKGSTVTGNRGGGINCDQSSHTLTSCIVWGNEGLPLTVSNPRTPALVSYSCIEGAEVWPGDGNINQDPLFCGWTTANDLFVDPSSAGPGEGTAEDPYPDLASALDYREFSFALSSRSPCVGTGAGGVNMGAATGVCGAEPISTRRIHLAPGKHRSGGWVSIHNVTIEGAGEDQSVIEGAVDGLLTGATLSRLTVTGGPIVIPRGQSPAVVHCTVRRCPGSGIICQSGSSPTLSGCTIRDNQGAGILCLDRSSPRITTSTVSGNGISGEGGIACSGGSSPSITSSIVWDNAGGPLKVDAASNPKVSYSCVQGDPVWPGEGNINQDPLFCGFGPAGEIHVDGSNAGPGDGTAANPYPDLGWCLSYSLALSAPSPCRGAGQGGVDMGAEQGTCEAPGAPAPLVQLAGGTYQAGGLVFIHPVEIRGAAGGTTVLEGTILGLRTGSVLSGLTITSGSGDGVRVPPGEGPELRDCTISGNPAYGVRCGADSRPVLRNCDVSGNSLSGVLCDDASLPTLIGCSLSRNGEAGIYCVNSKPVLEDCRISGNVTGVLAQNSSARLTRCLIAGNQAHGLICNESPASALSDCVIADNWLSGIQCYNASPALSHCTISGNAARGGNGIYAGGASSPVLSSSIVWGNAGPAVEATQGLPPTVSHSCTETALPFPGEGNINQDPLFCGLGPSKDLHVDASRSAPGDGSAARPFPDLASALEFSLALSSLSPCLGTGEDGGRMGAATGLCDGGPAAAPVLHLAGGAYSMAGLSLVHSVSLAGAGQEKTMLVGTVFGLRTGASLSGLTVTKGESGGLWLNQGESPRIAGCAISENTGRGVTCNGSSPVFTGCLISGNQGGVACMPDSAPTFEDCKITGNSLRYGQGAGVWAQDSAATFKRCAISGNSGCGVLIGCPPPPGGGEGPPSPEGGGVFCQTSEGTRFPRFIDCAITGNSADRGGGVFCAGQGTSASFDHCTVAGNLAASGGGIQAIGSAPTLKSSIVWGNAGGDIATGDDESLQPQVSYSLIGAGRVWPGEGNIDLDPLFCGDGPERLLVDPAAPPGGDGTPGRPFARLESIVNTELKLSRSSPCRGAGEGGSDMGSGAGTCDGAGTRQLVSLAAGRYSMPALSLFPNLSLEGAGEEQTLVQGTVFGLGTGGSLSSLTVTGGMGIQVAERSAPRISHCRVEGNLGAGITCGGGSSPNIADCAIRWNGIYNAQGGGVVCEPGSAPVLERCRIQANLGSLGGGVACRPGSSPVLKQCIISGNQANNQRGGGLFFDSSSRATLTNCLIMGNRSEFGSALYCQDASPVLWNCTIAGNAEINGQVSVAGRLEDPGASVPVFTNCVLPDIWLDGTGDAYWVDDHSCYPDGSFVRDGVFDFDRLITVDVGDRSWSYPDFIVEEPDFHLQAGSGCMDSGLYPGSPAIDLEGRARPCGNGVDIGAYESGDCSVRSVAFRRGDADANGSTDVTDAIVILGFLYLGDPRELPCRRSADTDENAEIEITDAISLLEWLFLGGPPPGVPVEACGFGARPETLSCDSYPPCS